MNTLDQALVPRIVLQRGNTLALNALSVILGVALVSILAQVAIPLPHTPVPITGQTFGVMLLSLLWGRRLSPVVILSYLAVGALGAPVFALGKSGFILGPTCGYLVGMLAASYVIGFCADRGATQNFFKAYAACLVGSLLIFGCGLAVLSHFIAARGLLAAGLFPFILGDVIKTTAAALIATRVSRLDNPNALARKF